MKHIKVKCSYDKQNTDFTGSLIDDNGDIVYYLNGICHREDGPAAECADGYKAWYYNNELIFKEKLNQAFFCMKNLSLHDIIRSPALVAQMDRASDF